MIAVMLVKEILVQDLNSSSETQAKKRCCKNSVHCSMSSSLAVSLLINTRCHAQNQGNLEVCCTGLCQAAYQQKQIIKCAQSLQASC